MHMQGVLLGGMQTAKLNHVLLWVVRLNVIVVV